MAVKLRLVRIGKKKQPTYRLVAADSRAPRNGKFLEIVGTQPTERVAVLLKKSGAWEQFEASKAAQ